MEPCIKILRSNYKHLKSEVDRLMLALEHLVDLMIDLLLMLKSERAKVNTSVASSVICAVPVVCVVAIVRAVAAILPVTYTLLNCKMAILWGRCNSFILLIKHGRAKPCVFKVSLALCFD